MPVAAIIVAGGRGLRLGGGVPKPWLDLGGRTMVGRSVDAFDAHARVDELVVVVPADLLSRGEALVGTTRRPCRIVAGGERRQDSVRAGLDAVRQEVDVVLVHDAARPFVAADVIDRVIDGAIETGAAVPAVSVPDTIKRVTGDGTVHETVARADLRGVQTPQGFARRILIEAMGRHGAEDVTDDAMLVERMGHPVRIVTGDPRNVKITTPADLESARARVLGATRVGTGYDLHRLAEGRPLMIAGVTIDGARGPVAHSDGDVVCHAMVDALLGAAAAGDIGQHFPNSDPRWRDAPGLDLLARAVAILRARGFVATSVDATVVLERPALAPHMPAIREALARVLGLDTGAIGLKAKTNEGVDAVGRGEAIAAHAVAVVRAGDGR